jgi:hypothetical protein
MTTAGCEIAWAAGLFEGEGTITQSGGRLYVRLKMTDESIVLRFAEIARSERSMARTVINGQMAMCGSPIGFG